MQLQMETCDLDECDFLETKFVEYPDMQSYNDDIDADDKPTCFGEYLEAIDRVEIIDIDDYDIEEVCSFIDQAYDFTPHRNHPRPWQSSL